MKELEKIREALGEVIRWFLSQPHTYCEELACEACDRKPYIDKLANALSALASLEKAGEGEDWSEFVESLTAELYKQQKLVGGKFSLHSVVEITTEFLTKRLSFRAALSDEEQVRIKRETLEGLKRFMSETSVSKKEVFVELDRQLASLEKKEEAK